MTEKKFNFFFTKFEARGQLLGSGGMCTLFTLQARQDTQVLNHRLQTRHLRFQQISLFEIPFFPT